MNKYLKLILIILAFFVLLVAVYFFAKGMTGNVVLNNDKNNTKDRNNFASGNEIYDRNINNYNVTNKTPEELNEGECTIMENGRKVCLVKRGAKVRAGVVNIANGQSG